jgi:PPOX class probable F420-dependent enzyme
MPDLDPLVAEFLKEHRLCVLATGRRDGSPQQSLVAYHFDGTDFAISARAPSAKARNARRQERVSVAVADGPRVVVVYGTARLVRDPEEVLRYNLTRLLPPRQQADVDRDALARRLRDEDRVVIVVTPEKYLASRLEGRR